MIVVITSLIDIFLYWLIFFSTFKTNTTCRRHLSEKCETHVFPKIGLKLFKLFIMPKWNNRKDYGQCFKNILEFWAWHLYLAVRQKNECYRCAKNEKIMAAAFNYFYLFLKIGEFPRISENSWEFLGIPWNFRELPRGIPEFW